MQRNRLPHALAVMTLFVAPATQADTVGPNPGQFHFIPGSVTYNGSGCPNNATAPTMVSSISDDGTTMSLLFSEFGIEVVGAPRKPGALKRKNCGVNAKIHVPHGLSFAIAEVSYRGFAALEQGVVAQQNSSYWIQGASLNAPTARSTFQGPQYEYGDIIQFADVFQVASLVWSPCGQDTNFVLNSDLRINNFANPTASGQVALDSTDAKIDTIFNFKLVWKQCQK